MAEDGAGTVATTALDVHKVAVGCLNQSLELVTLFLLFVVGM